MIGYSVSIILTLVISYLLSLFFKQNSTLEIFFIIQIAGFVQAVVGNFLGSLVD